MSIFAARKLTVPPAGVYFTALSTKFTRIWESRSRSACTHKPGGTWLTSLTSFFPASFSNIAETSCTKSPRLMGMGSRTTFPVSMSERFSRSLIKRPIRSAWLFAISRNRRCVADSSLVSSSTVSRYPLMAVNGVRNSWDTFATNSARTFSSRRNSVMSCRTSKKPRRREVKGMGIAFTSMFRKAGI